ncbi:hypothetical protein MKW98_000879 [Papaver atlanticum]|uniref:PGG domain-containing protein n=1 Tax=Papaver atlanticum TaxID=357466 RepID=A0AAD4SDE4_9MAGN|nr:hypothetical protein MKW98_000879 [Papaver atlanticum]
MTAAAATMELNEIAIDCISFCSDAETQNSLSNIIIIENNPEVSSCYDAAAAAGTDSIEITIDSSSKCYYDEAGSSSNQGDAEQVVAATPHLNEIIVDDDDDSTNYVEITLDVRDDDSVAVVKETFLEDGGVLKNQNYPDISSIGSSDGDYWKSEMKFHETEIIEMQNHMKRCHLWGVIDGGEPRPSKFACFGYNYYTWKVKDKRARDALRSIVGSELVNCGVLESNSAKEVWDKLLTAESLFRERCMGMVEAATTAKADLDEVRKANDEFLTPSNYHSFKLYLKQLLRSQYLWGIVDGSDCRTSDNYYRWEKMNMAALSVIQSSCGPAMLVHTEGTEFAQEAWSRIALAVGDFAEVKDSYAKYLPLIELIRKDDLSGFWSYYGNVSQEARADRLKEDGSTALHVAVELRRLKIVKKILQRGMDMQQSEIKTDKGNAAISLAVEGNNMEMVKLMLDMNPNFLLIQNEHGHIPLLASAINGDEEMLRYLYQETPMEQIIVDEHSTKDGASASLSNKDGATLITAAIRVDIYDVALDLLMRFPRLATTQDENGKTVFSVLAGKPSAFPSGNQFGFFQRRIYGIVGANSNGLAGKALKAVVPFTKQLHDKREKQDQALQIINFISPRLSGLNSDQLKQAQAFEAIYQTTIHGIIEFFTLLTNSNHNLINFKDEDENGLFQHAVLSRQEKIFLFIVEMGLQNQSTTVYDKHKNNILHCAGFWKPSSQLDKVSGAALQMQREIQWYQEVEKVVKLKYREMKNNKNKRPEALFTQQHRTLVKEGEKWIKEASQACMVVSTLIATVMFAAAFTVPGGNNQNTGLPIFIDSPSFLVFIVSDAVSLFASCTSILMFFTLLTARYAERDFQTSLPRKLILGLFFLFVSIAFMMATFAATLVIVLHKKISWVYAPVILLATIPVFLFGSLQFPLFYDIVMSTYGRGIFHRKKESSFCSNTMMRLSTWWVNNRIYAFFRMETTFTTLQRDWSLEGRR